MKTFPPTRGLLAETIARINPPDAQAMAQARARQALLTKPAGSLGRLEELATQIAGITAQARPRLRHPSIITMAADHGIAGQGVSAYPQSVTRQMVANFLRGGAAINVLARHIGARMVIVDMGTAGPNADDTGAAAEPEPHSDLINSRIAPGTRDFSLVPAMSRAQAMQSVECGIEIVTQEIARGADLIGTGDMGIGNTTASSAVTAAITRCPAMQVTGRGTGVDAAARERKIALVERALARHSPDPNDGLDVLTNVGGFEIGGLAGVVLGAAAHRVPVVVDGFISGAAALIAFAVAPAVQPYLIAGHLSVEPGHRAILEHLRLKPLLDLDLRLGEGTGAALAISLCVAACKLLDEMATFGEAGVSEQDPAQS